MKRKTLTVSPLKKILVNKLDPGVFVVEIETVVPAVESNDYSAIKNQLNQSNRAITGQLLEALKDKFGVVDQRYKFY